VVSIVAFTSWIVFRKIDQRNRAAARMAAAG
jgi:hypothetical protein